MENNNMSSEELKTEKRNIGIYKKIDNILDNDRLIKIYGLLQNKESKREFLETILSTYGDRLSEKFADRLEEEFEANDSQLKQGQLKENTRNKRSIEDVIRSRRREPLTKGVTERINYLVAELQKGNYVSKEDRDFLARHLAERSNVVGASPSSRREEIRETVDTYIKAKNQENRNIADSYKAKQDLRKSILRLKGQLQYKILHQNDPITQREANVGYYGEDIKEDSHIKVAKRREKEIQDIKKQIAQLEELQAIDETSNPLNTMLNMSDQEFDVEKNNIDLEQLMEMLDRESAELLKNGSKLPRTGIKEDEVVEIDVDTDKDKGKEDGSKKTELTSVLKSAANFEVKEPEVIKSSDGQTRVITPEEIEQVVMIHPQALKVIKEAAETKQLVGKTKENKTLGEIE